MSQWVFLDAAAQSTAPGAITNVATTIVLASSAAFGNPTGGQQIGLVILDSGNVSWNATNPLATPYEYVYETGNVVGTNTITVTRARAGTTAKAFSAGATIAAVMLAEALAADGTGAFSRTDAANFTPNLGIGPVKISEVVTTAGQASVTFSSIPSGFRHLRILYAARDSGAGTTVTGLNLQFNGDVGFNYYVSNQITFGIASQIPSEFLAQTAMQCGLCSAGASAAGQYARGQILIPMYADATGKHAIFDSVARWGVGTGTIRQDRGVGSWGSTAAITQIALTAGATFAVNSVFTLQGEP